MSKSKDALAAKAVLEYLVKQNRPYSAVDIFNNLHKEHGKTLVVKVLESLAQEGKCKEKLYGKQKVYCADQSQFAEVNDSEIKAMDEKITAMNEEVKTLTDANRQLDSKLRGLNTAISTEEARTKLAEITQECVRCKEKISLIKGNQNAVSPAEREKIVTCRTKFVKEWRKRKRMSNDILNAILEGYPKTKKQLFEEVGIETDEEYKVAPPEL